jgi:hypothetical protein
MITDLEKREVANWSPSVDVYIIASYTKIHNIDTLNQRFQADAIIESRWYDPNIKNINDLFDEKKIWKPELYIENGVKDVKEEATYTILPPLEPNENEESRFMMCEFRKITGLFYEHLELVDFPLDVQDLTMTIASKKPDKTVNFILMQKEQDSLNISHTLDTSEWKMHHLVLTRKFDIFREYTFGSREYPAVQISAKAFRLGGFFFWNAVLPVFLITLASLTPFSVEIDNTSSRLGTTCTLIFTSVGTRFTIGRLLPTVSYLTELDKYSIESLFIITVELCYHAIMGSIINSTTKRSASFEKYAILFDKFFFYFFCFLILLKELLLLKWYINVRNYRRKVASFEIIGLNDDEDSETFNSQSKNKRSSDFLKFFKSEKNLNFDTQERQILERV